MNLDIEWMRVSPVGPGGSEGRRTWTPRSEVVVSGAPQLGAPLALGVDEPALGSREHGPSGGRPLRIGMYSGHLSLPACRPTLPHRAERGALLEETSMSKEMRP